eukprot:338369-Chlamydomonas_euryale.AAC.2
MRGFRTFSAGVNLSIGHTSESAMRATFVAGVLRHRGRAGWQQRGWSKSKPWHTGLRVTRGAVRPRCEAQARRQAGALASGRGWSRAASWAVDPRCTASVLAPRPDPARCPVRKVDGGVTPPADGRE